MGLTIGSLAGIAMNTAAVLPPLLLGATIDSALAFSRGEARAAQVAGSALLFVAGTLASEAPRILKRWLLITANARIRADLRADCVHGILAWPMEQVDRTPVGELISRVIGDVEVVGVGVREVTIEAWDTVLLCATLAVTLVAKNPGISLDPTGDCGVGLGSVVTTHARQRNRFIASRTSGFPLQESRLGWTCCRAA